MSDSTQGFRLSPQQRNLWQLLENNPDQRYRATCALLLEGDLQPRILERALYELVQRHEILRTTFQRPQGVKNPFQVVSTNAHPAWQAVDLSHLDTSHQEHRIEVTLTEEHLRRFDFERGPLMRVNLFKLSPHRRVMTIALPALCADAASLRHFVEELRENYEAIVNSRSERKHRQDVMQYADFSEWQHELREADDAEAAKGREFWSQSSLRTTPPLLPFERKIDSHGRMDFVRVRVPSELLARLKAISVPVPVQLFAAWQALMWRLSGQSEFVIFNLFSGRKLDDLEGALGLYDSYLPVDCADNDVPYRELVSSAHQKMNDAHEWLEYFEHCSTSDHVAFEFIESQGPKGNGLTFSFFKQEAFHQPFKLKLVCRSSENSLAAELRYDSERFDRVTVERMAGYFERVVAQTSDGSRSATEEQTEVRSTLVGALDILGEDERRTLLYDRNRTEIAFSQDQTIPELFEKQVERTPDAPAVVCDSTELSYAELNERANQLAEVLRERGVKPNDRVGLALSRSIEVIVALLGALKAGAAYVPLNPEHPKERLSFQLSQSQASVVISNAGSIDSELNFHGTTLDLELHRDLLNAAPKTNPGNNARSENLAYVIYTSGSTGVAKGVAVQHRNLVNYSEFILRLLAVDRPLHFATVTTITADLGNTCIFPALLSGGCLHVLSYDVAMEGELFKKYVAQRPIDVLKIVPSHLQALLATDPNGEILPSKFLLLGGEAFSWELAKKISELRPDCQVFNHYGPTETTVGCMTFKLGGVQVDRNSGTVPIGRPIANTRAYVLNECLQPQPDGVAGELFIGGAGVSTGYLNQPAETSSRFIADPFTAETGARLYRTGDRVRSLRDGNFEFLGRIDNQIKVRGFRVEPGEIETVLSMHPLVQQAVVVGSSDGENSTAVASADRLVAYVVTPGVPPSTEELRSFLAERLPDYMIPSVTVALKALPLTANGKIDRAALPKPEETRPELMRLFVAPRNETEKELAGIWAGLLKVDAVGVNDNFFELGGHSLLATQVVSRMRQAFRTEIPLRSLFEAPTVAGLAERIEAARVDDTERLLAELDQLSDEEAERLLKAQTGE
jgi:amino acid adenylation domain-containing protein